MKQADAFEFYRRLAEADPSPQTELEFVNPYTLLVAVALSAQATDVSVNKATRSLFDRVTTPQAMLDFGEEDGRWIASNSPCLNIGAARRQARKMAAR